MLLTQILQMFHIKKILLFLCSDQITSMSLWSLFFLIIHTCGTEVAFDHMGWHVWGQLTLSPAHLLAKRAQMSCRLQKLKRKLTLVACTDGWHAGHGTHANVRQCIFTCLCIHVCTLEQKGKWKEITVMRLDVARWTHGELFCGETTRHRAWTWLSAHCNLSHTSGIDKKRPTASVSGTRTNGKRQEVHWTQVYCLNHFLNLAPMRSDASFHGSTGHQGERRALIGCWTTQNESKRKVDHAADPFTYGSTVRMWCGPEQEDPICTNKHNLTFLIFHITIAF